MTHDDRDIDFVRRHLQSAIPPLDAELRTDLWPRMVRRLDQAPLTFGWFEAALLGLVALVLAIFPDLLPALLYHL